MTFRPSVFMMGLFICYLALCLLMPLGLTDTPGAAAADFDRYIALVVGCLVFCPIPVALLGMVLGVPLGLVLRRVRNQWLHVLAFLAVGAAVALLVPALVSPGPSYGIWVLVLLWALPPAIGRLSVWKLVTVHDQAVPGSPGSRAAHTSPGYGAG